jgi:Fe-Mn family superoxide dismutase
VSHASTTTGSDSVAYEWHIFCDQRQKKGVLKKMPPPSATYKAKQFNLSGLKGISDKTLEMHLKLYEGYVQNTNKLTEQLDEMARSGKAASTNPAYAEITRGLGFEYNGMILHEYYFGNLQARGSAEPSPALKRSLERSFGSVDSFMADFKAIGGLRGVGWAILFQDPVTTNLSNHWITLHENGHPAGFKPLLVMDVWEHAFILDYAPAERAKYIEAFFANVDWTAVNERFLAPTADRRAGVIAPAGKQFVTEPVNAESQRLARIRLPVCRQRSVDRLTEHPISPRLVQKLRAMPRLA